MGDCRACAPSSSGSAALAVTVDGEAVGACGRGPARAPRRRDGRRRRPRPTASPAKVARLRIFENDDGKFDLSVIDTGGEALVVSQFTLLADTRRRELGPASRTPPGPRSRAALRALLRGALAASASRSRPGVFGATDAASSSSTTARSRSSSAEQRHASAARRARSACRPVLSFCTAFHCLTKWARGAHFC